MRKNILDREDEILRRTVIKGLKCDFVQFNPMEVPNEFDINDPLKVFSATGTNISKCKNGKPPINIRGRVWNIICKLDQTK